MPKNGRSMLASESPVVWFFWVTCSYPVACMAMLNTYSISATANHEAKHICLASRSKDKETAVCDEQ